MKIYKFIFSCLLILVMLVGCSSLPSGTKVRDLRGTSPGGIKTYNVPFDLAWEATPAILNRGGYHFAKFNKEYGFYRAGAALGDHASGGWRSIAVFLKPELDGKITKLEVVIWEKMFGNLINLDPWYEDIFERFEKEFGKPL